MACSWRAYRWIARFWRTWPWSISPPSARWPARRRPLLSSARRNPALILSDAAATLLVTRRFRLTRRGRSPAGAARDYQPIQPAYRAASLTAHAKGSRAGGGLPDRRAAPARHRARCAPRAQADRLRSGTAGPQRQGAPALGAHRSGARRRGDGPGSGAGGPRSRQRGAHATRRGRGGPARPRPAGERGRPPARPPSAPRVRGGARPRAPPPRRDPALRP